MRYSSSHLKQFFTTFSASLILSGCASYDPNDIHHLSSSLPNFTQEQILPQVKDNQYCQADLDADLLYGMGYRFYRQRKLADAQTCLAMAAPEFPQAYCFLSDIAESSTNLTDEQKQQAMFRYTAFASTLNQTCAEYRLHLAYQDGDLGLKPNQKLSFLWLERTALHGDPKAQAKLAETYEKQQNDLIDAHAWVRIFNLDSEIEVVDKNAIKLDLDRITKQMTADQLAESDQVFLQNLARVRYKKDIYADEMRYKTAFYSASVHLAAPKALAGMNQTQREAFVSEQMAQALKVPEIKTNGQLISYIALAGFAQQAGKPFTLSQNPKLMTVIQDNELKTEDKIEKGRALI